MFGVGTHGVIPVVLFDVVYVVTRRPVLIRLLRRQRALRTGHGHVHQRGVCTRARGDYVILFRHQAKAYGSITLRPTNRSISVDLARGLRHAIIGNIQLRRVRFGYYLQYYVTTGNRLSYAPCTPKRQLPTNDGPPRTRVHFNVTLGGTNVTVLILIPTRT